MALRGFGGSNNGPLQPTPVTAGLEGLIETGTRPGVSKRARTASVAGQRDMHFTDLTISF